MTERFRSSRILLQTGIVAWLIIGPILLLQLVLSVSQPESALGACIRSGAAAAIAGAVIFFTRRPASDETPRLRYT